MLPTEHRRPRSRVAVVVVALVAAQVGLAAPVLAQPKEAASAPSEEQLAEAKKYFEAGLAFYKAKRFAEALAAFLEANRISPRESIQRNIAQTHRDLHDFVSADEAYEVLLTTYGATLKPGDRANVERARTELAALTGVLSVTLADPEATVLVDGREVGRAPQTVRLNVGPHVAVLRRTGFEPLETKLEIVGRDTIVVAGPLVPSVATGHLAVDVVGGDNATRVSVDGHEVGAAPWEGDLEPGIHRVDARSAVGASMTTIEVTRGGRQRATLTIAVAPENADAARKRTPDPADERSRNDGLYARIDVMGAFATASHDSVERGTVYGSTARAEGRQRYGGGVALRAGYRLGVIGIEGMLAPTYDHAGVRVTDPTLGAASGTGLGRTDTWTFHRVGGLLAVGARVTPDTGKVVRPTFGLLAGLAGKSIDYRRKIEGGSSDSSDFAFYLTPALALDAGVEVGSFPGGRLTAGVVVLADFPSAQTLSSTRSKTGRFPLPAAAEVRVATGPEVFVGPFLGVVLGH